MMVDDEQVKKAVVDQLYWDSRVNAAEVGVEVADGAVTLKGWVPTLSARRAAETDAYTGAGVRSVNNELVVRHPPGIPQSRDDEISSRALEALRWNPDIDASSIDVSVAAGWVTLEGTVDAYWKKIRAEELVTDVWGVTGVTNALGVVPSESIDDQRIADDIIAALERNIHTDIDSVDVEVNNGVVFLSGVVPDSAAYVAAYHAAHYAAGVVDINNSPRIE
ncbi:MAG: BON domain-containing protein [Chloroflexota bacterium]